MDNLKQLYSKDLNIMKYFREHGDVCDSNSMDAVLCAYEIGRASCRERVLHTV